MSNFKDRFTKNAEEFDQIMMEMLGENEQLRNMLALHIAGNMLYMDDGELQDNSVFPFIDFRRDNPESIAEKLIQRNMSKT